MIIEIKDVYCLKGRLGFLSDSEWDGDTFSDNPIYAYKYESPTTGGRITEQYECVKIRITTHNNGDHISSGIISIRCQLRGVWKTRYKCKCLRCNKSTNKLFLPETVLERFSEIMKTNCITHTWEYVK